MVWTELCPFKPYIHILVPHNSPTLPYGYTEDKTFEGLRLNETVNMDT